VQARLRYKRHVNRLVRVLVLVAGSACGHGSTTPSDEAERFERGSGVARDYTRAVRIYEDRCAQRHDRVACRKLAFALLSDRGEPRVAVDPRPLLKTACEQGDWLACVPPYAPLDPDRASAACKAGTPAACLAVTWAHPFNQSGTVEDEDHIRLERACNRDILEACDQLVVIARNAHESASSAASTRVQRACDAGDADACDALGHPLAPAELCRANDFRACAKTDDTAALDRACDHQIVDACEKLAIAARDADPPDPKAAARFARACAVGSALCNKSHPDDLAIGCDAYRPSRVPADRRVHLPALKGTDAKGAPWTAVAGTPFLILSADKDTPPQRYADVARRLAPAVAVYVIAPQGTAPDVFAPAKVVTLDAASAAAPLAAAGPADPGDPLGQHLGDGWPTVVDTTLTPRAVLSLQSGTFPATLARCTTGLLALP